MVRAEFLSLATGRLPSGWRPSSYVVQILIPFVIFPSNDPYLRMRLGVRASDSGPPSSAPGQCFKTHPEEVFDSRREPNVSSDSVRLDSWARSWAHPMEVAYRQDCRFATCQSPEIRAFGRSFAKLTSGLAAAGRLSHDPRTLRRRDAASSRSKNRNPIGKPRSHAVSIRDD